MPSTVSDSEQSEDSDAEFLVHPILRSLIKSKSAYTMKMETPRMRTSKTAFEINLPKMWESTTMDDEPPVANFTPDLDEMWPEPDVLMSQPPMKFPTKSRKSSCWSSPMNDYFDKKLTTSSPTGHSECLSAPPDCLTDNDRYDHIGDGNMTKSWSHRHSIDDGDVVKTMSSFSNSYPIIDTDHQVSPRFPIRLPSNSDTSAEESSSSSSSGPLSPLLERESTHSLAEISSTHSTMQQQQQQQQQRAHASDLSSFVDNNTTSDDDSLQREPLPYQEVWPEEEVMNRSTRIGWISSVTPTFVPRSQSSHVNVQHGRVDGQISESRSMHNQLRLMSSHHKSPTHSQLDEIERRDLANRSAWIDRGGKAVLQERVDNHRMTDVSGSIARRCQNNCHSKSYSGSNQNSDYMRRSYTTEELKRERRKLPKRPDVLPFLDDIPSSISLHGHLLYNSPEHRHQDDNPMRSDGDSLYYPMPPSANLHNSMTVGSHRRCAVNDAEPLPPINVGRSSSSLTGRRLPFVPVSLFERYPTTSMQHQNTISKPQDHTLCFIEGMSDSMISRSVFEDSYYEEDGINGNARTKPRKSLFSPDDSSGVSSCTTSDSLNPTHRAQSTFIPRHSDEILLDIGDAVHVDRTCEDHWCYGTNLRTGVSGIFPSAIVCEIDIVEEICLGALPSNANKVTESERDTFFLTMLASIEVGHHKGNDVLVQAMNKVLSMYKNHEEVIVPQTVLMEISFRGIHVIDKRRKNFFQCPTFDFFYSLQNISFCGAHPKQLKYFGFITKHPLLPRFACHVFLSSNSTQPIVESIGRAFKRSYDEYMAFAHPTEDIYLE